MEPERLGLVETTVLRAIQVGSGPSGSPSSSEESRIVRFGGPFKTALLRPKRIALWIQIAGRQHMAQPGGCELTHGWGFLHQSLLTSGCMPLPEGLLVVGPGVAYL